MLSCLLGKNQGETTNGDRGVTLELSAHSPSDSSHFFKELGYRSNDTPENIKDRRERRYHDPPHGIRNGRRAKLPTLEARMRVCGPASGLKFDMRAVSARNLNKHCPESS